MRGFYPRPRVSVILAAYNHEAYVEEAMRSVLAQTMSDLELIVVDDASTDRTAEVAAGIDDRRVRLFRNRHNREHHPRNFALSKARGRWIAFQNSDDVWLPEKLERQLALVRQRPGLSAVFTDVTLIGPDGAALPGRGPFLDPAQQPDTPSAGWLRRFLLHGNCVAIASALVRRSDLLRAGGMDPTLRQLSDFDLWIRMAAMRGCALHPEPLTKVRWFADLSNMSAARPGNGRRSFREHVHVLRRFAEPRALRHLPEVLPELQLGKSATLPERKTALALHAMQVPNPVFRLFSEWLLDDLLRRETPYLKAAGRIPELTDALFQVRASLHPPAIEP